MKDSEKAKNNQLQYETSCYNQENNPCNNVENVSIIVHKKKVKNRKKIKVIKYCQQPAVTFRLSRSGVNQYHGPPTKRVSMPEITKQERQGKKNTKSCDAILRKEKPRLNTKIVINQVREYSCKEYLGAFNNPFPRKWKIYRCQVGGIDDKKDGCCCSCNSDAMFEVMKSLYDCYKNKNCDYCNCILCGHLPCEERRLGEVKKSLASVGLTGSTKERKEKIKKAEKALEGKTTAEKENILKDLAKNGQPLPSGKTASEKALIKKVRAEMGLPPEPKTAEEKAKMRKAEAAGLIVPLEGKTTAQKEKILKAQADLGIPLPEGRTASEKALIHKIKAAKGIPEGPPPAVTKSEKALTAKVKSEKLRKAKALGLLTPLEGKTPEQKEKILKGLAVQGIPLPEGKTASEKKIIEKVRADLGLPPEPKTPAMKEKHIKAANAGLMQPLEGKTPKEKEKILQGLQDLGIPLPEGRTPSEKALIAKVKAGKPREEELEGKPRVSATTTEKLKKAKAAGLLTPLTGKPPEKQKKILRELAKMGLPLPEGKTKSEKELIDQVKKEMGVTDKKEVTPIESEKLRKAKAAGLLTPLEGKSKAQKEKIMRGLAKEGIPLPVAKTASEKKIAEKLRKELGLPPEPKTAADRAKQEKAAAAGILKPLEGLTPAEKEKQLRAQKDMGIELPEGRTKSEKALIAKIKAEPKGPPPTLTPSEKLKKAKAAGLITPLEGKTPAEKEKIMKGLAKEGLPLPVAKTDSEKKIAEKVRKELGLPPEPKTSAERAKQEKAAAAGILKPLEGLTPAEKEKQLRAQKEMGIELPEGRTKSEKALIAKIKGEPPPAHIPSEQLRRAKAAGLLTPLEGKTPAQKEKIMRGLAKEGIPLPVAKTPSEKKIEDKIRKELGLPPEPKTSAERVKQEKAAAAGILKPLEGLTPAEKEKQLRAQKEMGIELPEGRTKSEKALIAKIKAEPKGPPPTQKLSEKLRKAKAAGLITPLEGKTPAQKEKIMKGLAKEGLPLPVAKTDSEKKIADKVRKELGLPPEPKTAAERAKQEKAAAAGILKPLEGLTPAEKEKQLRAQKEMGIELPEGRTKSEKALIAKIKGEPPPAHIPSEQLRKAKAAGLLTPLEGKTPAQKEKIMRGLAKEGIPLPVAKTPSEKKIEDKIRKELGLPPEPKTSAERVKQEKAAAAGILKPLEGLTPAEKEKQLRAQKEMGIELPEGRTKSEKALIAKIKAEPKGPPPKLTPSEKLRKAKAAGLITPLEGKTPAQKEKIMKGLAKEGLPLPEAKTASEKKIADKVRKELGLPPEPKTSAERVKQEKAAAAGILKPLEGLTPAEKEKQLRAQKEMGIELPEGRTKSEKALIAKIKAEPPPAHIPSEKLRKAKAAGLLTPLEGKTPAQKEKIIRGLAKEGLPLPVAKTASEKKIEDKVRKELGLPPAPKTAADKAKQEKAAAAGILKPLEGLTPAEKEKQLRAQKDMGIELPEGRTKSEKALIAKIKAEPKGPPPTLTPSEKLKKAKAAGLITPLEGKTPAQKEKIMKGLAKEGLPLPVAKTDSEKKIADKVRKELGLPPEPKTSAERVKQEKAAAAGILQPLEGLTPAEKEKQLRAQKEMGIELPEGRTKSEKALIAKIKGEPPPAHIPSEQLRKAKAAGLLTPLEGKTPAQKEKILKGLAKAGIPLPVAKTPSEKKIQEKIRKELGLPPEPKTAAEREKQEKAAAAGVLKPLEGLSPAEKEKVLKAQAELGMELPEGRTKSEKDLIAKVKAETKAAPPPAKTPSEKLRKARAAGLITPLEGKTPAQKEKIMKGLAKEGLPLPVAKTASEKKIADKVRKELGLPPEPKTAAERAKQEKAAAAGILKPLEGLTPAEKEKQLRAQKEMGIELPEGRTKSEKALIAKIKAEPKGPPPTLTPSEKLKKAKAAGLLTPLEGKTPAQKEKIMRGLAKEGIPLPVAKTPSEKKIEDKIRKELGLPPEPKTSAERVKQEKAAAAGILKPLEGLTPAEKEKQLRAQKDMGIELPEGRTKSEKALIAKIKAEPKGLEPSKIPSEKLRKAKAAGLITPLEGKTPAQKEKIIRGLAKEGLPLPVAKTASEKKIADKVRKELGLPPEPKTAAERAKQDEAAAAGMLKPLEGLTPAEKEKQLRAQKDMGIELPEGRTKSEKALIAKIKAEPKGLEPSKIPSEKLRKAKAAGLITPLEGKTPAQKEKIIRGLAKEGLPLPVAKTASEKKIADKVRKELGLPPEPKTAAERAKQDEAAAAGMLKPLEGLTPAEKEKQLRAQKEMGIELPEGRTKSEKALIAKIKAEPKGPPPTLTPSEKLKKAKAAGLITPLEGKTPAQKEKIMKGLAKEGLPLPEAKTASEKKIAEKVRKELGLPPEPKTAAERAKQEKAAAAGMLKPLEGLTPAEKEKQLRAQKDMGIELPEGRTKSEKALIAKIKAEPKGLEPSKIPSEKLRKAKAAGLITPLEGKTPAQKEKIIRGLAKEGLPLPVAKTASEKKIADKVRKELGLPPEPKTAAERAKQDEAAAAGMLKPLEGLTPAEKEKQLRAQKEMGIELPEGRTKSEKALIAKIKAEPKGPPPTLTPSEKLKKAKAAGLITPLEGKTPAQKEKIMKGLAKEGLPLPVAKTASEKKIADKVRKELGLPPEPKTAAERAKQEKAAAAGMLKPLEGLTPAEKEKQLRAQKDMGIELPEGRTKSEKALIAKIKAEPKGPEPSKIPSEKLRKAKAAGLITPLEGKTPAQKEKIIRGLANEGLPLPVAKTASEKKLEDKIRKELGLPPEPKTAAERAKQEEAAAAGMLKPLEGLTPAEKEKQLRAQKKMGIELPEGRTKSEKDLIAKIKAEPPTPSEQLRKAKAAGLLTPLEGKTRPQKEKILKNMAKEGIPLPEAKTASDKKLQEKVRKELGLPPEPKTAADRAKQEKAAAAGVLRPLEGLTPAEKEKQLRAQKEMGIELPQGRTKSEKALIAKIKAEPPPVHIPSEQLRKAKAAGLLTPLEGKTPAQKEKIMRGLAKEGIPLPVPKTASEKKIEDKVRKELGLPPEPKTAADRAKHEKAAAAGILKPLEGLTPAEKEKQLRAQKEMGIELPEGRTKSEKDLIAKIKAEPSKIPSEKLRKAKAAGLLTPLEGKSKAQKEKILRGLAKEGLPLPEGKTPSEKKLIDKVRKEAGVATTPRKVAHKKTGPPIGPVERQKLEKTTAKVMKEGKGPSEECICDILTPEPAKEEVSKPTKIPSEKLRKAEAAGLLTPLEGKTKAEKEKILKGLAKAGIPLPEAKTASDKKLADKVRKELGLPPEPKTAAEKAKQEKAAAAGVLVPLEGLSDAEKEKVLRAQAETGMELPEGRTKSEKALIAKVKAETKAPPSKALMLPLTGLSPAEKEKALRKQAEMGLPLPEGKTASEKALISKIKAEQTPSKKLKGKAVGTESKRKAAMHAHGVKESIEEIIKTTKCDRGCGCDKKKIRFKHSYVKIRVTSPDISSLCPCPNECIPGVKAGAFIDNEGIKVTVGVVSGVPSYTSQYSNPILVESIQNSKNIITLYSKKFSDNHTSNASINIVNYSIDYETEATKSLNSSPKNFFNQEFQDHGSSINSSDSLESHSYLKQYTFEHNKSYIYGVTSPCDKTGSYEQYTTSYTSEYTEIQSTSRDSFDSILIIQSESSLHLNTNTSSSTAEVNSVISYSNSSFESHSTHYLYCLSTSNGNVSVSTVEELELYKQTINYSEDDTITSSNSKNEVIEERKANNIKDKVNDTDVARSRCKEYFTFRSSLENNNIYIPNNIVPENIRKTGRGEPIIVVNSLNSEHDIGAMVDELLSNSSEFCEASCIFVVVPTADDESDTSSEAPSSTLCVHVSENYSHWRPSRTEEMEEYIIPHKRSLTISSRGKKFLLDGIKRALPSFQFNDKMFSYKHLQNFINQDKEKKKSKLCQVYSGTYSGNRFSIRRCHATDTTEDRPCCCQPVIGTSPQESHIMLRSQKTQITGVVSEVITPLLIHQGPNPKVHDLKNDMIQQASIVSINRDKTTTTCRLVPSAVNDFEDVRFGAPHGRHWFTPKDKQCQCKPGNIKELLEQAMLGGIGARSIVPLVTTGCGSNTVIKPSGENASLKLPTSIPKVEVINENCAPSCKPKFKESKLMQKCHIGGTKKSVKTVKMQQEPVTPVSLTVDGPKSGSRSLGCQCCFCEDAMLAALPGDVCPQKMKGVIGKMNLGPDQMEVLGPQGGLCFPESGGTYTQAGTKQRKPIVTVDNSTDPQKSACACYDKKGKKKKKVDCQCPFEEPEPVIIIVNQDDIQREFLKEQSIMTQTQSGFRVHKKGKPKPEPEPEIEYTLEDAVRFYAAKNPDRFKDIMNPSDATCIQQSEDKRAVADVDCACTEVNKKEEKKKHKKSEKKSDCECETPKEETEPDHFTGLKFTIGGKGSGSKGLSGICCFDMIEERKPTQ